MPRHAKSAAAALAIAIVAIPIACGSKNPEPATPANVQPTAPPAWTSAPTAATSAPTTATTAPPAASSAAPPAALCDAAAAAGIPVALQGRAAAEAPGMKAFGAPVTGCLQEGQTLTGDFGMEPGKCYTVLGQGVGPIQEVDMTISPKLAPQMILFQDTTAGPNSAIGGGKGACIRIPVIPLLGPVPVPAQMVLTVKATKGQGAVGAQVFAK